MAHIDEYIKRYLEDSGIDESQKIGIRRLYESQITHGKKLESQGLLKEAVNVYRKEHSRTIKTSYDAEIVQCSYFFQA
jgi:hypothetical protein